MGLGAKGGSPVPGRVLHLLQFHVAGSTQQRGWAQTPHTLTLTHVHVHCNSTADHKVNTGREQHLYKLLPSTDALALFFLSRRSELQSALTQAHISPGEMVFDMQPVEYLTPGTSLFQLLAPGPPSCGYFMALLQQPVLRPPFLLAGLSILRRRSDRTHAEER